MKPSRATNRSKQQRESHLQILKAAAEKEACTANGRRVEVAANIGEVPFRQRCHGIWRRGHWLAAYGIPLSGRYPASQ